MTEEDQFDWTQKVENYQPNSNSNMFTLNSTNVKSALVYVFLSGLVEVLVYIIKVGDLWQLDFHTLVNGAVIAASVGLLSVIKNFFTTYSGHFLGVVKVAEEK